ncbi:hypothetical protein ALC53_03389 [Atta colombica]|uniref:Uncharacterized protein n=1 Tax=Atta colombica TaxID=520822 RepID=A0A195BN84_9HYME|nr:hypothetical protein ALC53_03389 [Atta colombica]
MALCEWLTTALVALMLQVAENKIAASHLRALASDLHKNRGALGSGRPSGAQERNLNTRSDYDFAEELADGMERLVVEVFKSFGVEESQVGADALEQPNSLPLAQLRPNFVGIMTANLTTQKAHGCFQDEPEPSRRLCLIANKIHRLVSPITTNLAFFP